MKKVTRKQAQAWLAPLRQALHELRSGEIDAIDGHPVVYSIDKYVRLDSFIAGYRYMILRIWPNENLDPVSTVERYLAADIPLTMRDIENCQRTLDRIENRLTGMPWPVVRSAIRTEEISIEMENLNKENTNETT